MPACCSAALSGASCSATPNGMPVVPMRTPSGVMPTGMPMIDAPLMISSVTVLGSLAPGANVVTERLVTEPISNTSAPALTPLLTVSARAVTVPSSATVVTARPRTPAASGPTAARALASALPALAARRYVPLASCDVCSGLNGWSALT